MIRVGEAPTQVTHEQSVEVEHYYWVEAGLAAEELGVDVPAVCGVWEDGYLGWDGDPDDKGIAEAVATSDPEDCRACLRVLEQRVLRRLSSD